MTNEFCEITLSGFDGGTDETDDSVLWVRTNDREALTQVCDNHGAKVWDLYVNPSDSEIDFDLTTTAGMADFQEALIL